MLIFTSIRKDKKTVEKTDIFSTFVFLHLIQFIHGYFYCFCKKIQTFHF
jgi:hypothetical protein